MAQAADLPGAVRLELLDGVIHLDPKPALFDAMLTGWVRQQQTRFLSEQGTIKPRVALVRRLAEFTNAYPWEWTPSDVEAFFTQLRSSNGRKSDRPRLPADAFCVHGVHNRPALRLAGGVS